MEPTIGEVIAKLDLIMKMQDERHEENQSKFKYIFDKLDGLLGFKWQVIGAAGIAAFLAKLFFKDGP